MLKGSAPETARHPPRLDGRASESGFVTRFESRVGLLPRLVLGGNIDLPTSSIEVKGDLREGEKRGGIGS